MKLVGGGAFLSTFSAGGLFLSNSTAPAPRNLFQVSAAAGVLGAFSAPTGTLASSDTHTVSGSGSPTVAASDLAIPFGGPCNVLAPSSKLITGGVLSSASTKGATTQRGSMSTGIELVLPLTVMDQVSFLSPKSLGTLMVKTPHCRPGRKCVGWPWSGPPGSILLFGPMGISRSCLRFRL